MGLSSAAVGRQRSLCFFSIVFTTLLGSAILGSCGRSVGYDHRALLIDGQRRFLISGSIHYPRSTPQMWPTLLALAKAGGLDVIETYVFWNGHEPVKGQYNFQDRYDLLGFLREVQKADLLLTLRIGPYISAEWNFGGFPNWLLQIPGIEFRTDNEPHMNTRPSSRELRKAFQIAPRFKDTNTRLSSREFRKAFQIAPRFKDTFMSSHLA